MGDVIFEPMKIYRLVKPEIRQRPGQHDLPQVYCLTDSDGVKHKIPFGAAAECREKCAWPFEYSTSDGKWLVHINFLRSTKTRWKQL